MTDNEVVTLGMQAFQISLKLGAPILLTALILGFGISLFQSVTQIQEATLSFVPKAAAVAVALVVCGHWMISEMVAFTNDLFAKIPSLLGGL
jgi:flagellar biosynthetic protein FliQ